MSDALQTGCDQLLGTTFHLRMENLEIHVDYIYIARFEPGYTYDFHMHSNYEFHYIAEGRGQVNIEGRHYELKPGDFYITGPYIEHWQKADDLEPMVEYCMRTEITIGPSLSDQPYSAEVLLLHILGKESARVVRDEQDIKGHFEHIFIEASQKKVGYQHMITHYLSGIIIGAARDFCHEQEQHPMQRVSINAQRVQMIRQYIFDNLHKKLTYETISNYMFLSKRHLERIIKEETGETLHDFMLEARVKKAVFYLENTNKGLREIAELVGFSNEFHLSRTIKRITGKNPSGYKVVKLGITEGVDQKNEQS